MTSVGRNVVLSTLAGLANQLVRAGQQLLWVPLFLTVFGPEGYGEWLILFGLAGYAAMADLGVQVYWLNLLTRAHVRREIEDYRRIFRAGLFTFLAAGGLTLAASVAFSLFRGPSRFLGLAIVEPSIASIAFVVLVSSTILSVLARLVRGVFRTVGENPKVVWFEVVRESLTLALVAGGLFGGLGPLALSWVYLGIAVLMVLWAVKSVRERFPALVDFGFHRPNWGVAFGLVRGGSIHLAGMLANLLLMQGTLIITNWALGAVAVALVATARTLSNLVRQVGASVYLSTLPEFSRLEAANDKPSMDTLLRCSTSFVLVISGMASIALVGLGPWLFDLWTGGSFPEAAPLIYLFAASVVVDALRMPLHDFLLGCNRIAWVAVADIVYAVSSLALMWVLFDPLGVWSVPLATMASGAAIHLVAMAVGTRQILGRRGVAGLGRSAVINISALGLLLVGVWRFRVAYPTPLAATLVIVFIAIVFYGVYSWMLTFTVADRAALIEVIQSLTNRIEQVN